MTQLTQEQIRIIHALRNWCDELLLPDGLYEYIYEIIGYDRWASKEIIKVLDVIIDTYDIEEELIPFPPIKITRHGSYPHHYISQIRLKLHYMRMNLQRRKRK